MNTYSEFIATKTRRVPDAGFSVDASDIHPALFDFQRLVTQWAIRKGRAAIFLDTGLGKTFVQAEVMRLTMQESGAAKGLIIAPLSVARQTIREVKRVLGYDIHMARSDLDVIDGINITNYEMIDRFDYEVFGVVGLDESSILKSVDGKTRERLFEHCKDIPFRHCYTATPAPNDISEMANHAEFLGVMTRTEMLSQFFVHDDEGWRLKRPAINAFYQWLASWGMSIRKPSDIGFDDNGYVLPELTITPLFVDTDYKPQDQLFFTSLKGITERVQVRKHTLDERVEALARLVNTQNIPYNVGYENTTTQGIREGILSNSSQGTTGLGSQESREEEFTATHSQTKTKPAESEKEVHEGLAREEQRARQSIQIKNEGKTKRPKEGSLRNRRTSKIEDAEESKGISQESPRSEKGSSSETIRADSSEFHSDARESEQVLRDMRALRLEQQELLPNGRPFSLNEQGSGSVVSELQSRFREVQGQPRTIDESRDVSKEQWVIWCGLNTEQDLIYEKLGSEAVSIHGSQTSAEKERLLGQWMNGEKRFLISKPKVLGFGMNFQQSHKMAFLGLSDSWESYYQCIRRCYRFGQTQPVEAYIVLSTAEAGIHENILKKEAHAKEMSDQLIKHVREYEQAELGLAPIAHDEYRTDITIEPDYTLMLGDSVERIKEIPSNSIDMMVYSPPFASLYTYSPSERDMGNSATPEEFLAHFSFLIREQLRVLKPGRVCCVHVFDIPAMLVRDGYIGLKDFSGDVVKAFITNGFVYDARIPIDKNPQAQSIRTRAKGLTFTQMEKDRTWSRPGLPDYILKFRKPGENAMPVSGGVERDTWIEWASPTWGKEEDRTESAGAMSTWYGIHESDTLNAAAGRDTNDERHIAPLQLETIRRCILLWSNQGEVVFTPFAGIGSELYVALENHRKAIGIELKPSYYRAAQKNLRHIIQTRSSVQNDMFAQAGMAL